MSQKQINKKYPKIFSLFKELYSLIGKNLKIKEILNFKSFGAHFLFQAIFLGLFLSGAFLIFNTVYLINTDLFNKKSLLRTIQKEYQHLCNEYYEEYLKNRLNLFDLFDENLELYNIYIRKNLSNKYKN